MQLEDIVTKDDLKALETRIAAMIKNVAPAQKKDPYMTLKEAAAYIKTKPQKLGEQVRAGDIPFIRDGRLIKFDVKDLDAYMRAHRIMSDDECASAAMAL